MRSQPVRKIGYAIDWHCEDCRKGGVHFLPLAVSSERVRTLFYVGGSIPSEIVVLYNNELNFIEADHAATTGCKGRVRGEGGAFYRPDLATS
jgi:hypothetical protein